MARKKKEETSYKPINELKSLDKSQLLTAFSQGFNSLNDYKEPNISQELTNELITEMLNFTPIAKAVESLTRGIISRDLIVKSEDDTEDNTMVLEIQGRINRIKDKTRLIENLVMSCFSGRTLHEIIYNEDFSIKEFKYIPFQLVDYDKDGKFYKLKTREEEVNLSEMPYKWLLSIYGEGIGNRLGKSLLKKLIADFNQIKVIQSKVDHIMRKYGETLIAFGFGVNQTQEQIKQTAEDLKAAYGKNVIAIPLVDGNLRDNIFTLRLTDMDTVIHERLISKHEKNIVTTLLGGSLTIDNDGGSGSYALGSIQQEEKEKIEDSIALYVRDELDKIIEIDAQLYGYDPTRYYISIERAEKEEERLKVEKSRVELLNTKISGLEGIQRAGYIIEDDEEIVDYLGFKSIVKKETTL